MAASKNTSKPNAPRGGSAKRAAATLRSTSGAGFEFEDLISAWQLVKALSGEQVPGTGGVVTQVQAQAPRANMTCCISLREISEQRGPYDEQPATQGPNAFSQIFNSARRIARRP